MDTKRLIRLTGHQNYRTVPAGFIILLMITGWFTITTNTTFAATYYLDAVNGNDNNAGTSSQPWKTLSKAENTVVNGDFCFLKSGNYGEVYINKKDLNRTGWNDGVTYKAQEGQSPVFSYLSISGAENRYLTFDGIAIRGIAGKPCVQIADSSHIKLLNMDMKGFWSYHNDAGISPHGVYLKSNTTSVMYDITVENCQLYDINYGISIGAKVGTGLVFRNNDIHHFGSTGISSDVSNEDTSGTILIDGNRIYNKEVVVDKLFVTGEIDGTFTVGETVQQSVSGGNAIGNVSAVNGDMVSVRPTSPVLIFDFTSTASNIVGTTSGAVISKPALNTYVATHGSGISIRNHNVTITNNIIRDCGPTRGIRTYQSVFPVDGYNNIRIENNLIYDIINALAIEFVDIGDNFVFNNNTVIGYKTNNTQAMKYASVLTLRPASSKNGSGFAMYNNILVGTVNINPGFTDYNENNNIIWSVYDWTQGAQPVWRTSLKGDKTIIIAHSNTASDPTLFEVAGKFFKGGTGFDTYNLERQSKVIDPYGGIYSNRPHGQDLSDSYKLADKSPAIGFANSAYAPATDILGNLRNNAPSVGCYEYVLSFAPIGNKEVNEGSTLTFTVDVNEPNMKTSIEEHNLPSEPNFINNIFNWIPAYEDAGSYEATFVAQNDQFEDFETISINVNNVNRAPVLAAIGDKSVNENNLLSFVVSATDPDGDEITYSAENLPSGATFAGQTFNWTPDYGQAGTYQVKFTATDGQTQDSQTANPTVNNVNRSPVLAAIGDKSVNENGLLSFVVSATDPDGDEITYSAENLPSGATFAGQTFNWTPDYGQAGTYQVKFTATDGQAQTSQMVNLTVNDITTLFKENFNNGTFTGWSIIDEGTIARPSSWSATSGTMVQKSGIYASSFPSQPGTYALYKAGSAWTNYRVSFTMKSTDNKSLGIMFRYKDKNNYYRFSWDNSRKLRQMVKKCNGKFSMLCLGSVSYVPNRDYQVDIVANGALLQVFIDNTLVLQAIDGSLSSGSIALYSWANAGSYFDNIVVRKF